MARRRMVDPGFFTHEGLATVEPLARLLFIGLWTLADREGKLEDRPLRLKAALMPFDTCNVDSLLGQLAGCLDQEGVPLIYRYAVGAVKLILIPRFYRQQHPHHREPKSSLPFPGRDAPTWCHSVVSAFDPDKAQGSTTMHEAKP